MISLEKQAIKIAFLILICSTYIFSQEKVFLITSFGAKSDGVTNNAKAIQSAIDKASLKGGEVIIPAGNFASGVICLKSNVELHLDSGARLLGSTKRSDYNSDIALALIVSKDQENISITGQGVIDGQAPELIKDIFTMLSDGTLKDPQWEFKRPTEASRPKLIEFINCKNVTVSDVSVKNAASWVQNYSACTNLVISNIKVESTTYWNNDGIDISDCKKVKVTNCFVNAADDGICLKSESSDNCCEDIEISDCTIRSSASAFKIGTASKGGFKNVTIRNLNIYDTYRSALAIEMVDGGILRNININNINARNTGNAIFIRLGHRNEDTTIGELSGIHISGIKAEIPLRKPDLGYPFEGPPDYLRYLSSRSTKSRPLLGYPFIGQPVYPYNLIPSSIVGVPGAVVKDVLLENIEINFAGGGRKDVANIPLDSLGKVPEKIDDYPEFSMFGELPSWGFYIRHTDGIKMRNIKLNLNSDDFRPAIVFDDVKNIELKEIKIPKATETPIILFHNVINKHIESLYLPYDQQLSIKEIK
ncbi:MAG: glycosyl hydrolase family 28 protein [Bacteroidota bacterium]|nr:glycosyl hydrolase family 28 protein [Bacteroidota bacterium]